MTDIELFGYVASAVVAVSLMMKNALWLRILNGIGAVLFVIYGLWLNAYPVAVLNGFIVIADAYYIVQILREKKGVANA